VLLLSNQEWRALADHDHFRIWTMANLSLEIEELMYVPRSQVADFCTTYTGKVNLVRQQHLLNKDYRKLKSLKALLKQLSRDVCCSCMPPTYIYGQRAFLIKFFAQCSLNLPRLSSTKNLTLRSVKKNAAKQS
jgi:hypothetical protein